MAGGQPIHPWFMASCPLVVTSHHGATDGGAKPNTIAAYRAAYGMGYRWFQVDVVPIEDALICAHAPFGRLRGVSDKTLAQLRVPGGKYADAPTLEELLLAEGLEGARWNVEVKSARARDQLVRTLKGNGRVHAVLVSAPFHPRLLAELRETFGGLVALAAPVRHGGGLGLRLGRPKVVYDCVQVHRLFAARVARSRWGRLLPVQSWTIADDDQLDAALDAGCHPIVGQTTEDTKRHLKERGAWPEPPELPPPSAHPIDPAYPIAPAPSIEATESGGVVEPPISVALLGGGGWRGAFGSIGAVMYLHQTGRWAPINDVVAISGGSFVTAALAAQAGTGDADPTETAKRLLQGLLELRRPLHRRFAAAALPAPLLAVAPLFPVVERLWLRRLMGGLLHKLFGATAARSTTTGRRYVICAAGRATARPYFFVAGRQDEAAFGFDGVGDRAVPNPRSVVLQPGWRLVDAVQSATSLPGLDGYRAPDRDATPTDDGRGEVLIDGGVQGIFGRQFFERGPASTAGGDSPRMLILDAGREERRSSRLMERVQALSTIALLARWVQIALDAGFRDQVGRTHPVDRSFDPGAFQWIHLVRIAEPDPFDWAWRDDPTQDAVRRLEHGRRIVHRFGLTGLSPERAYTTLVVAIAACAFELEPGPVHREPVSVAQVHARLAAIETALDLGDALTKIWDRL